MSQFPVVKRFVYHLVYYRTLSKAYSDSHLQNEFWTLTIDAHLLQAVIHWCMVFGSDGCNPTHWKKLSLNQSETLRQNFCDGLFGQTDLTQQTWESYWREIVDFRNNYAAHRALGFSSPVPHFDMALEVACYYDNWIRKCKRITKKLICEQTLLYKACMRNFTHTRCATHVGLIAA